MRRPRVERRCADFCDQGLGDGGLGCLCQRSFSAGQPEHHLHGAVRLDGGGQFSTGLLPPAKRAIQGAEAEVAMGLERAHAQLTRQGEGLEVVPGGGVDLGGRLTRRALAEKPQPPSLVATLPVSAGEIEGLRGAGVRVFETACQQIRLAEAGHQG
jgi:hypothetical protein